MSLFVFSLSADKQVFYFLFFLSVSCWFLFESLPNVAFSSHEAGLHLLKVKLKQTKKCCFLLILNYLKVSKSTFMCLFYFTLSIWWLQISPKVTLDNGSFAYSNIKLLKTYKYKEKAGGFTVISISFNLQCLPITCLTRAESYFGDIK